MTSIINLTAYETIIIIIQIYYLDKTAMFVLHTCIFANCVSLNFLVLCYKGNLKKNLEYIFEKVICIFFFKYGILLFNLNKTQRTLK